MHPSKRKDKQRPVKVPAMICAKCSAQLMDFELVLGDGLHCHTCQPKIYIVKAKEKLNSDESRGFQM